MFCLNNCNIVQFVLNTTAGVSYKKTTHFGVKMKNIVLI